MKYHAAFLLLLASLPLSASVIPEPLPAGEDAPAWEGSQFVQADRAGRVFFLRGDTLEVFPLTRAGGFGEPARLEATAEDAGYVHRAVLSANGDQWLLHASSGPRLFVDGKEKALPSDLEWSPWSVGFVRDTPVAAVIPRPQGRARDLSQSVDVPWFLKLSGGRWSSLTMLQGVVVSDLRGNGKMNGAIAESAVFLRGDREGKLWAARQYAYRVQRFSPTGRVLTDLTVDGGKVRDKEAKSKGIEIKLHGANDNPTEATRNSRAEKGTFYEFTAQPVILDLTEGLDGKLYLLIRREDGGMALDRFDDGRGALDRVTLQMKAPASGTFTIAAGRGGLYIAAFQGKGGRWRIPWDVLDAAEWTAVEGAEIDGAPASGGKVAGTSSKGKP